MLAGANHVGDVRVPAYPRHHLKLLFKEEFLRLWCTSYKKCQGKKSGIIQCYTCLLTTNMHTKFSNLPETIKMMSYHQSDVFFIPFVEFIIPNKVVNKHRMCIQISPTPKQS